MRFPGATHLVALAKQMGSESVELIESRLEGKFQLEINREKTRVVDLREEAASLTFLGYTYRYDHDLKGRARKYLNVFPSRKAVQREKEKLHEMTDCHQCFKPIPVLIGELTRHLKGWTNYFHRVPHKRVLRDRTPCSGPSHPAFATPQPKAVSAPERGALVGALGAVGAETSVGTCACLRRELSGEPDAICGRKIYVAPRAQPRLE